MKRYYVDADTGRIERVDLYLVRLIRADGSVLEPLEPRRLFPFTDPSKYVSLLDSEEKEVALIRDVNELDRDSAKVLEDCFREYYMIPRILRVTDCEDKFGMLKWSVETDRGSVTFRIRNRHSDIKKLYGTKRVIIRDSNDNRYEIRDYTTMDAHSLHLLFSYL